jgi:hypothetical protein
MQEIIIEEAIRRNRTIHRSTHAGRRSQRSYQETAQLQIYGFHGATRKESWGRISRRAISQGAATDPRRLSMSGRLTRASSRLSRALASLRGNTNTMSRARKGALGHLNATMQYL